MVDDAEVGKALGLDITGHSPANFGASDEFLCSYLSAGYWVLEAYVLPPAHHRQMAIGTLILPSEGRPAPEEQPIIVEGATDGHGYLTFPDIEVRFETPRAFVLLRTSLPSDRDGLDKTVAVANLYVAALAAKSTS